MYYSAKDVVQFALSPKHEEAECHAPCFRNNHRRFRRLGRCSVPDTKRAAPQVQLVGTIQGGQPAALPNCATPACSPVILTVGDHIVADGIQVKPDGSFAAEPPGLYTVRATQSSGTNKIEDVKSLLVPLGESH
jgi:hypothetical protein